MFQDPDWSNPVGPDQTWEDGWRQARGKLSSRFYARWVQEHTNMEPEPVDISLCVSGGEYITLWK